MRYQAALRPDRSEPRTLKGHGAGAGHLVGRRQLGKAGMGVIGGAPTSRARVSPPPLLSEETNGSMTSTNLFAPALAAATAAPSGTTAFIVNTAPLVLVFIIFWLLMIRPQQKRMRDHQARIAAVKKGDRVVTGGGLIGRVTKVGETEVEVELGQGIKVTAVKSTLTQVIDPTAAKPAND